MSGPGKCVTAVVAGAMTVGIGAAGVMAVPANVEVPAKVESRDVGLVVTIFDFDETFGPLRIIRRLFIEGGVNPLEILLRQEGGNTWNLPGLNTGFDSISIQHVLADSGPGFIDFGWDSDQGQIGGWTILEGDVLLSSYTVNDHRDLHFRPLLGGSEGIGAALYGTLADDTYSRNLSFFGDSLGLVRNGTRTVGDFNGELAFMPFDGFKAVLDGSRPGEADPTPGDPPPVATLIGTDSDNTFNLGSLEVGAGGQGSLRGNAGLCFGSAQGSCGGNTAFLTVGAPVEGGLTVNGANIISGDFSTNEVVAKLGQGQFSVEGAVGGTISVGSLSIGQPIPINFQFPNNSAVTSLNNQRQTQTVRNSFMAVPGKSASDDETGGRHRATPLRDAVANIRTAVRDAVQGRDAPEESED